MGNDGGKVQDRKTLLDLLERAALERDAASQLLLSGGTRHGSSAALHVFRSWHAIAAVQSRLSGDPDPDLETFELTRESDIVKPMATKKLDAWADSYARIRHAALVQPWYGEADKLDPKDLRRQIRLLGRCISAQRRRVISSTGGGFVFRIGWRHALIAAAALVLAIVAVDLGSRIIRSMRLKAALQHVTPPDSGDLEAELDELGDYKPRGTSSDGAGNIIIRDRLRVALGGIKHPEILSVSLDGNDRYKLRFLADGSEVGFVSLGPAGAGGLEVYSVTVPEDARVRGFDRIDIEVADGDGAHSVGHLLLSVPADSDTPADSP